jgi:hypothetical protein
MEVKALLFQMTLVSQRQETPSAGVRSRMKPNEKNSTENFINSGLLSIL